jgi:putative phage-type endonuclease
MNEIQGSDAWFEARLGKATASHITDILATVKTGEATTRRNYRMQLVCERLTGRKADTYTNAHMERGNTLEPLARSLYEIKKGVLVSEVGFINHPIIAMAGASPDGLVDGLIDGVALSIEIKCPTPANHVETILRGTAPSQYFGQMQWQMACLGKSYQAVDFVSYCPDVGEDLELFVVRVPRDNEYIAETEMAVQAFLNEVTETYNQLKELKWL